MTKKIASMFLVLTTLLLIQASEAFAGYCLVYTEKDNTSDYSLRGIITNTYNAGGSGANCTPPKSDSGWQDPFDQVILFATLELGKAADINTIVLDKDSPIKLSNSSKDLVIGNWDPDVIEDTTSDILSDTGNEYYGDYTDPDYTDVIIYDYGRVTIDASGFSEGVFPFECGKSTMDTYLRHVTVKLNGISEEDFWALDCIKDGGDVTISTNVEAGGDDDVDGDGYTVDEGDCDDNDPSINPGVTNDSCDGVDSDCDGTTETVTTYYYDGDDDGYYADGAVTQSACAQPEGYTTSGMNDDCDDADSSVNPGVSETCGDGIDNNCDDATDPVDYCTSDSEVGYCSDGLDNDGNDLIDCEDIDACALDSVCIATTTETICDDDTDNDGDGYTDCEDHDDCDADTDACPASESDCDDLVDNDGNGDVDCDDSACSTSPSCEGTDNDNDGITVEDGDCDDTDATIYPGAGELCGSCTDDSDVSTCTSDAIDQDCDGLIDEGCNGSPNVDDDGDGLSENAGDCDDTDDTINPDAVEICDDGIDNDCDGTDVSTESEEYLDGTLVCDLTELPGSSASTGCGCDLTARKPDSQTLGLLALLMFAGLAGMGVARSRTVR